MNVCYSELPNKFYVQDGDLPLGCTDRREIAVASVYDNNFTMNFTHYVTIISIISANPPSPQPPLKKNRISYIEKNSYITHCFIFLHFIVESRATKIELVYYYHGDKQMK